MATPWGPSAVPTGGAGVALPAGIWIFTTAATFFLAMFLGSPRVRRLTMMAGAGAGSQPGRPRRGGSDLGDLAEVHLDQGLPAEDVDQHLELEVVDVDLGHRAGEVGERALP